MLVTEVIDGDTVNTDRFGSVRLIGVDTPEVGACYDDAATRFTKSRLDGEMVGYELGEEREDRYGRTLAYLYRNGMHNLALVEEGYAEVLTIPPNDKYEGDFERAEQNARSSSAGLWRACDAPPAQPHGRPSRQAPGGGAGGDGGSSRRPSPAPSGDIDCDQVAGPIPTPPGDPSNLDGDNDGLACE